MHVQPPFIVLGWKRVMRMFFNILLCSRRKKRLKGSFRHPVILLLWTRRHFEESTAAMLHTVNGHHSLHALKTPKTTIKVQMTHALCFKNHINGLCDGMFCNHEIRHLKLIQSLIYESNWFSEFNSLIKWSGCSDSLNNDKNFSLFFTQTYHISSEEELYL